MTYSPKVAAVVVTYNRKELLMECLSAIIAQSYPLFKILIIDNASTDGTEELLQTKGIIGRDDVIYQKMATNTGGSGGFYAGLKMVQEMQDVDWAWIMDDDTIPYSDSLESLVLKAGNYPEASYFASCVKGENDEPMNVPITDLVKSENGYLYWYKHLKEGMVNICSATFVSILINKEAIKHCGLPCRDYFIWGDDFEYTRRLRTYFGNAYMVGSSWVCHKRKNAKRLDLRNENERGRIKNYYYFYRNNLINYYLYDGAFVYLCYVLLFEAKAFGMLTCKKYRFRKFWIVQKSIIGSLSGKGKFKRFIEGELHHGIRDYSPMKGDNAAFDL